MARRAKGTPPSYRLHKQSGQAVVSLPIGNGRYRDVLLGPYGSDQSRAEYGRVIAEWQESGCTAPPPSPTADLSVNELVEQFWLHVQQHYRDCEGKPTSEVREYKIALRFTRKLYGHTAARDFGSLALKAVRSEMVKAGLARGVVNQRVGRIKRCFTWAVSEELVPATVAYGLASVKGLQRGRTEARETEPVKPVAPERVEAILPFLTRPVRGFVQLLRLTGMRPTEACIMRRCDLDISGQVWTYTPHRHKNDWRGLSRVVALGPKAQAIVRQFFVPDLDAYLFRPADGMLAHWQKECKSRRRPCRLKVRERKLESLRPRYTVAKLDKAIQRACDRAFPPPADLARRLIEGKGGRKRAESMDEWQARLGERWAELVAWQKSHRWSANQLRHLHATEVRRQYGIEAASTALGHHRLTTTEVYAEKDLELAKRVAAAVG